MAEKSLAKVHNSHGEPPQVNIAKELVGIVSASSTGLQEVAWLLAREGVGVSQTIYAGGQDRHPTEKGGTMLAGLQALQADPATEVIALVSATSPSGEDERVLDQVRDSEKPTVVCFLGADQRLVWRAGAIPAARLDETAMRAAAWVRGWDQALVTSRLEDEHDQMAALVADLRAGINQGRQWLHGLFTSEIFFREAQLMLSTVVGGVAQDAWLRLSLEESTPARLSHVQEALDDPSTAAILLDVVLKRDARPDPAGALASLLRMDRGGPAIIAHVCGIVDDLRYGANQEARLRDAGVVLASSNAAAARLAGMLVDGPTED